MTHTDAKNLAPATDNNLVSASFISAVLPEKAFPDSVSAGASTRPTPVPAAPALGREPAGFVGNTGQFG